MSLINHLRHPQLQLLDPRRSITLRLTLVFGVVVAFFALLESITVGTLTYQQMAKHTRHDLQELSGQLAGTLDRGVFERYREIQILVTLDQLSDPSVSAPKQRALLEAMQHSNPDYAWVGITDAQGTVQVSTGGLLEGVDVSERPWFQGALDGPFVGDVHEAKLLAKYLPNSTNEPLRFVDIAAPIIDSTGQVRGVLGAHLSWQWASEIEQSLRLLTPPDLPIEVLVLQQDRTVILGPRSLLGQQLQLKSITTAQHGRAEVAIEGWPDGASYLTSVQTTSGYRTYPGLGWLVVVRTPVATALAPAQAIQQQVLLSNAVLTGVCVIVSAFLASHITRPLRRIAAGADTIRSGDPGTLPVIAGQGEVARLSHTLRNLIDTLRKSEARYRGIVEDQTELICRTSPVGTVTFVNAAFCRYFECSHDHVVNRSLLDVMPGPDQQLVAAQLAALTPERPVITYEHRIWAADGSLRWQEWTDRAVYDPAGQLQEVQSVGRDITHRKQAEAQRDHQRNRLSSLLRVAARLNAHLDLARVLDAVSQETQVALGVDGVSVLLYDADQEQLMLAAVCGLPEAYSKQYVPITKERYDRHDRTHNSVIVIPDIQKITDMPGLARFVAFDIRTVVSASMVRDGELIGAIITYSIGAVRTPPDDELLLLKGLADQAALAIANARAYDAARQRLEQLQALHRIDLAIVATDDEPTTLKRCLHEVRAQLNVDGVAVLRYNPAREGLDWEAGIGLCSSALAVTASGTESSYAWRVVQERQPLYVPNFEALPANPSTQNLAEKGIVAYYGVPLMAQGQLIGVLELYHRQPLTLRAEWVGLLETLAGQVAIAIDHRRLLAQLQQANIELCNAYDATIEGWARALDLRDKETEGHSRRVTELTVRLAQAMGMGEDTLMHIRRGALLHDIGKMGVPDQVLHKPGALSDDEWTLMRKHPAYAYDLLQPIHYLQPALAIPYCHHEKWDGTGYPQGLKGEAIPLAARIFAIVDVWDALTSDRPYRAAWDRERALAYISDQAGRHFDPAVVRTFVALIRSA